MKLLSNKAFLSCASILVLFSGTLSAESAPDSHENEHVVVESRPMSEEKRKLLEQKNNSETEKLLSSDEEMDADKELENYSGAKVSFDGINFFHAPQLNAKTILANNYYYPTNCGWLNSISIFGDSIEFGDGSQWKISSNDAYKVLYWRAGDPLVITPCESWFSSYRYYITNKNTYETVSANLFLGPIAFGTYTHWIVGIDFVSRQLFLENGAAFKISSEDIYLFNDWAINDTIILGVNDSWFSAYDYILINVNMNNFAHAKQL